MKERPFFRFDISSDISSDINGISTGFQRDLLWGLSLFSCVVCHVLARCGMYLSSPGIRGIRNHALQLFWHIDFSYFVQYTKPYKEGM